MSGHVHLFEVVSFSTPQPAQFVSGNGGDWIDTPLPFPLPAGVVPAPGTVIAGIVATNRFGFMTMERDGARWRMVAHDARGAPQISCTLQERQASCLRCGADLLRSRRGRATATPVQAQILD